MKRKILKSLTANDCTLVSYRTERSDMGVQCYTIEYTNIANKYFCFTDGYFVGSGIGINYIFDELIKHIKEAIK